VDVAERAGLHVRAMIAPPTDIRAAIRAYYGVGEEPARPAPPPKPAAAAKEPVPEAEKPGAPRAPAEAAAPPPEVQPSEAAPPKSAPASSRGFAVERAGERARQAPPKPGGRRMIALTLLDGTTIRVPAKDKAEPEATEEPRAAEAPASSRAEDQLTAKDIVAALRAASHGADASDILGENARWEAMFAALLSVLVKKHLITDFEFIEEFKKS
jgi:hypothetical protein